MPHLRWRNGLERAGSYRAGSYRAGMEQYIVTNPPDLRALQRRPLRVVALGRSVLRGSGGADTAHRAARQLAQLARNGRLVVVHQGRGPLDAVVPCDETEWLAHAVGRHLPPDCSVLPWPLRVSVDEADPAFRQATHATGPVYAGAERDALEAARGWRFVVDGTGFRRALPEPRPQCVLGLQALQAQLAQGRVLVCAASCAQGLDAVLDVDAVAGLLARQLRADLLVLATGVDAVYLDWGRCTQRPVHAASPAALESLPQAGGSMRSKIEAACTFVRASGQPALIGSLDDIDHWPERTAGTWINPDPVNTKATNATNASAHEPMRLEPAYTALEPPVSPGG